MGMAEMEGLRCPILSNLFLREKYRQKQGLNPYNQEIPDSGNSQPYIFIH